MSKLEEIQLICNGIEYSRRVPEKAIEIAEKNNIIIIVGGSDDLMYCYGAKCYLTDYCEHSYGWDGNTLKDIGDKKLEKEAAQIGLMIWWCGEIEEKKIKGYRIEGKKIKGYRIEEMGAFSYTVNNEIKSLNFKVIEGDEIYCTGKIIELPENFIKS